MYSWSGEFLFKLHRSCRADPGSPLATMKYFAALLTAAGLASQASAHCKCFSIRTLYSIVANYIALVVDTWPQILDTTNATTGEWQYVRYVGWQKLFGIITHVAPRETNNYEDLGPVCLFSCHQIYGPALMLLFVTIDDGCHFC